MNNTLGSITQKLPAALHLHAWYAIVTHKTWLLKVRYTFSCIELEFYISQWADQTFWISSPPPVGSPHFSVPLCLPVGSAQAEQLAWAGIKTTFPQNVCITQVVYKAEQQLNGGDYIFFIDLRISFVILIASTGRNVV